ncbi:hypothetical protein JXO52_07245 [bacterium]|nr:hypothetical protein [bacterium]
MRIISTFPDAAPPFLVSAAVLVLALLLSCDTSPLDARFDTDVAAAVGAVMPDSLRIRYHQDAAAIVLREEIARGSGALTLPAERIDNVYNALTHVYSLRQSAARDTVVKYVPIHAAMAPHPNRILVEFDSSAVWAENWQRNILITGRQDLDRLMQDYVTSIPVYYFWGARHAACLETAVPLNTSVLAGIFAAVEGIRAARPVYQESGTDIEATARALYWELFFIQMRQRYWVFRVYRDGTAFYLDSGRTHDS